MGEVKNLKLDDGPGCARWDAFVRAHRNGTMFHLSAWTRAVADTFGHDVYQFYIERDGEIAALLPLTHIKSRLFGNRLVSNGFGVYGGPLADRAEDHAALDAAAWEVASRSGVGALEYRDRQRLRPDWPAKSETYATFTMPIPDSEEECFKLVPSKRRNMIRKAIKMGLGYDIDSNVERHYAIYAECVRNLGTPVFPKALFQNLLRTFGEDCVIQVIHKDGVDLSSAMSFIFRDEIHIFYAGGTMEARQYAANDFMFWSVMQAGRERGLKTFDLGRSKKGTGSWAFKELWKIEPQPLHYEFRLRPGETLPDLNPTSGKYALMVAAWRKLPLPLANALGPLISRSLG